MQTPHELIDAVVRSVAGRTADHLTRVTIGGLNETYRLESPGHDPIIVRIAHRPQPWFTHEAEAMRRARAVGVPTPHVLGVEHVDHEGTLLSFSVLSMVRGRALDELADDLSDADVHRLVRDGGELLARLHSIDMPGPKRQRLEPLAEPLRTRALETVARNDGAKALAIVEQGITMLAAIAEASSAPAMLGHGDWLPKHVMIDAGEISGLIDWEFAGPAAPAFDLAHWEVAAGTLRELAPLLREGYARVSDPAVAGAGLVPACAVHFALEILSWQNPASPARIQQCIDVINRHACG